MSEAELRATLGSLSLWDLAKLEWRTRWLQMARPKQVIDFNKLTYDTVFIHAGRGFGKSLTLSQWIAWELCEHPKAFGHIIAPTHNDIRYVNFEGESGIIRQVPSCLIKYYNKTDSVIQFYNDSVLRGFSAEESERLRGPQCHFLACDEVAAWIDDVSAWEQAKFGHRLGKRTTCVITSTPKPKELIKTFFADKTIKKIGGNTEENRANLSDNFLKQMNVLKGTRLGRQELAGELLDAEELGVIKRSQWQRWPHNEPLPDFEVVLMSLDTALSEDAVDVKKDPEGRKTDYTACSVWGAWKEPLPKEEQDALDRRRDLSYQEIQQLKRGRPQILLLDAWQDRLGFPDLVARVKKEKEKRYGLDALVPKITPLFGPKRMFNQGRKADLILIEDKNSGISLRQQLRREGVPVMPYNPGKADKLMRLNLVAPMFVQQIVWAPLTAIRTCGSCHQQWQIGRKDEETCPSCGAPQGMADQARSANTFSAWAEPLIGQMCAYAGEYSIPHDDLMDSATQALLWLFRNWLRMPVYQEKYAGRRSTPATANPYAY
jgi:phage terminase large subunit-like protein